MRCRPATGIGKKKREETMPLYMSQIAYTPEAWAAQIKNPQNRVETVARPLCEAAGGKLVGGWLCFGEYDALLIADMPDAESQAAVVLAVAAGGSMKVIKTTELMTGAQGVEALKKAGKVAKGYKPAK
jgi:uncharacterized protein with GYD domain